MKTLIFYILLLQAVVTTTPSKRWTEQTIHPGDLYGLLVQEAIPAGTYPVTLLEDHATKVPATAEVVVIPKDAHVPELTGVKIQFPATAPAGHYTLEGFDIGKTHYHIGLTVRVTAR